MRVNIEVNQFVL